MPEQQQAPGLAASVVVPVHDAEATLGDQLEGLARQEEAPGFEVVVVLNRCRDRSRQVAEAFLDRLDLVILTADERASAGYARNAGAGAARGRHLLFCDADDRVGDRWVVGMVRALDEGGADFVGGRIVVDRSCTSEWIISSCYAFENRPECFVSLGSVRYPISATFGVRRADFEAVGGFDESLPGAAGEDADLALRLYRSGRRVGYAGEASLLYRPRTTLDAIIRQKRSYAQATAVLLARDGVSPRVTFRQQVGNSARLAAQLVVRRRVRDVRLIAGQVRLRWATLDARRQAARSFGPQEPSADELADFLVPLPTPTIGGLALRARSEQARWYEQHGIERTSLGLMAALVGEGGTVVDCGANIGVFTVAAAKRVGPSGRVLAFEPDARTRDLLVENVRRHGVEELVSVHASALGSTQGTVFFLQHENDVVSGLHEAPRAYSRGGVVGRVEVEMARLDDVESGPVDLVKIDVEGSEPDVLAGARAMLAQSPGVVMLVECNPASLRSAGSSLEALLAQLTNDHTRLWLVEEFPSALGSGPLDDSLVARLRQAPDNWYGNLLVAPATRGGEIDALVAELAGDR